MAYNKVIYNNSTLIDLTNDNVTASDVLLGKTFHLANGESSIGTLEAGGTNYTLWADDVNVITSRATSTTYVDGISYIDYSTAGYYSLSVSSVLNSNYRSTSDTKYYCYYSGATSSDIGDSILNHASLVIASYNYPYLSGGPFIYVSQNSGLTLDRVRGNSLWMKYSTVALDYDNSPIPSLSTNATIVDWNGIILDVDNWTNIVSKLNNHYYKNGIFIFGNFAVTKSSYYSTSYGRLYIKFS